MRLRSELVCMLVLLLCTVYFPWRSSAEHTPEFRWMYGYRNANGISCCGENDCRAAAVSLIPEGTDADHQGVLVDNTAMVLPRGSVHQSETTQSYWCYREAHDGITADNTRCVFYALGL